MAEEDTPATALVRLEGKLDALSQKLDLRLDMLISTIDSGDRASRQLIEGNKADILRLFHETEELGKRITNVSLESERRDDDISHMVGDFGLVRRLVFGTVTLILLAVASGVVALVVVKP